MRALATLVSVFALLAPGVASYMDDPGTGGEWGVFYACLPEGCGWWLCWPGSTCEPV